MIVIHYDVQMEKVLSIELANTGLSLAHWQFIPKHDETTVCPSWLRIDPSEGILNPMEAVCN